MTQEAVVTNTFANGMAEVSVQRGTACGGNCGSCEACAYQNELKSLARNRIGAARGSRVIIESKSSTIIKAAILVYIMPLAMFILGYIVASMLGCQEGGRILASFLGLALGAAVLVVTQRRKGKKDQITFDIIAYNT